MEKLESLSIFFPAFNEEKNIKKVVEEAVRVAQKLSRKYEIIVVDDGSSDQTARVVENLSAKNKNIRLVRHNSNQGYGAALKSGFANSRYRYITYMDSDGQFDFWDLEKLIEKLKDVDIVVGYRINRADNFVRVINGKLWNLMVNLLLGLNLKDIDCGFKLIKREVLEKIGPLESNGATISAELLVKAKKKGFRITQIGLEHKPRIFGKPTGGSPLHIFRAFNDLVVLLPKI